MKCFRKEIINNVIHLRKEGYEEEIKKRNISDNDSHYCLSDDDLNYLRNNYMKEKMPSIVQMAKNAMEAAISETASIATGKEPASKERGPCRPSA